MNELISFCSKNQVFYEMRINALPSSFRLHIIVYPELINYTEAVRPTSSIAEVRRKVCAPWRGFRRSRVAATTLGTNGRSTNDLVVLAQSAGARGRVRRGAEVSLLAGSHQSWLETKAKINPGQRQQCSFRRVLPNTDPPFRVPIPPWVGGNNAYPRTR